MRQSQNKSNPAKKDELDKLVQLIIEMYDPAKIILFGSQARGDWREDSDFDLLVVDCNIARPMGEINSASIRAGISLDFDALKTSSAQIEELKDSLKNVVTIASKEGITLFEKV